MHTNKWLLWKRNSFFIPYNCVLNIFIKNTWYNWIFIVASQTRQNLTQDLFYRGGLGKREVEHESLLVFCWTMLVIDSLCAMWARWPCWHDSLSAMWVQHVCLLMAWTKPESLVQCCAVNDYSSTQKVVRSKPGGPAKKPGVASTNASF